MDQVTLPVVRQLLVLPWGKVREDLGVLTSTNTRTHGTLSPIDRLGLYRKTGSCPHQRQLVSTRRT